MAAKKKIVKKQNEEINTFELYDKLQEGAILDFQKPGYNKFERAKIIKEYMDRHGIDVRKMAKKCGIPHTTLFGWLKYNEIEEDQYEELLDKGVTRTQITNNLKSKSRTNNITKADPGEIIIGDIERMKFRVMDLSESLDEKVASQKMYKKAQEFQDELNKFSLKLYKILNQKK